MTEINKITRIRAALKDATYGPWTGAGPSFGKPLPEYLDRVVQDIDGDDCAPTICRDTETADAEYIAACNPTAITAVLSHIDAQAAEIAALKADAARYRYLSPRLLAAEFDWNETDECVLIFSWPRNVGVGGNCDMNIDAAIAAMKEST